MRVIQVNKFNYLKGGAEKYFLDMTNKLRKEGHEVAIFSMKSEKNLESRWKKYFISNINFNKKTFRDILLTPGRIIYSCSARRRFKRLVKDFKPDIVHVHNIYHQISPSILSVAKKKKIPVIMHLHDYKLVCPNYKIFTNNKTCTACKKHKYYNCFRYSCVDSSRLRSFLAMIEMYIHHVILKIYKKNVDLFISPSEFVKNTLVDFGWDKEKIVVINNYHEKSKDRPSHKEDNYLLYFGRLSSEKGVNTLIEAISMSQEKLKIAGRGPEKDRLISLAKKLKVGDRVEFLGFKERKELEQIINEAKAVIVPSIWPENMSLTMLEALAKGKLVIASNIGALPEIIKDGDNGLLFEAGDARGLLEKIRKLNVLDQEQMRKNAKESVERLELNKHFEKLVEIYKGILNNNY